MALPNPIGLVSPVRALDLPAVRVDNLFGVDEIDSRARKRNWRTKDMMTTQDSARPTGPVSVRHSGHPASHAPEEFLQGAP